MRIWGRSLADVFPSNSLLEYITEEATPNAYFATAVGTLADNLEEQVSSFLLLHPDTVLVVVDTFQMVRGNTGDPSYGSDYQDIEEENYTDIQ